MGQEHFSQFAHAESRRGANRDRNAKVTIHQCRIGPYDVRDMSHLTDRGGGPVTLLLFQPTNCLCVATASPSVMIFVLPAILTSIAQQQEKQADGGVRNITS